MPGQADAVELWVAGRPVGPGNPVPTEPAPGGGDTTVDQGHAGAEKWVVLDADVLAELVVLVTKLTDGSLRGTVTVTDGSGPVTVDGTVGVTNAGLTNLDITLSALAAALEHVSLDNFPADQLVHAANLDLATTALRDALRGASSKTLTDVVAAIVAAQAATTVANFPADQLVHASNLDLAVTALRDAIVGAGPKTLTNLATLLNGGLPAALGGAGGLKTEPQIASPDKTYTAPASGELQGSASALQLPNVACSLARLKAEFDNVGSVYIGPSGVTKADGTTDTTTGLQLRPGDDTGWLPIDNLNRLYRICDNAGDDLTYMVL